MGTRKTNKDKKNYIWRKLEEQGKAGLGCNEKKLIAEFVLDCFTSRKTALEFLKTFEDAERIVRKDGKVYSRQFFNADLTIREEVFIFPEELSDEEKSILES